MAQALAGVRDELIEHLEAPSCEQKVLAKMQIN